MLDALPARFYESNCGKERPNVGVYTSNPLAQNGRYAVSPWNSKRLLLGLNFGPGTIRESAPPPLGVSQQSAHTYLTPFSSYTRWSA